MVPTSYLTYRRRVPYGVTYKMRRVFSFLTVTFDNNGGREENPNKFEEVFCKGTRLGEAVSSERPGKAHGDGHWAE